MRTKKNIRAAIVAGTLLMAGQAFGQASVPGNTGGFGDFSGWDANTFQALDVKHEGNYPIDFYTTNIFRMRLNKQFTYPSLNGFSSVVADGFTLLSPNASFLASAPYGPFSRLHLADGTRDTQNFGYRPWQRNGISFTGNDDQGYIGQKYGDLDVTDMVIQWSDNPGFTKADRMRFIFTSQYQTSPGSKMNSLNGLEAMRLWPKDGNNVNVGIGDFATAGDDPLDRLDIYDGSLRIRQLPTEPPFNSLTKVMVVDNNGVVKWREGNSFLCTSGWSLQGNNAVTAFNGNPCPPQDANYVGMGTTASGFIMPVNPTPAFYTTKVNVLNNNFNTGVISKNTRTTTGENFGVMTDVTGSSFLNAGIEVSVHGSSSYTRGIRTQTIGATGTSAYAGAFLARDNATFTIGAEGISYGGTFQSTGLRGESKGTAMQNYGVHGLAPIATNSYAGYFSGEVMITADAYVLGGTLVTSDENLKTNVEDLDGSLGIVMQMHPKRYLFLQEALPQAHLQEGPQVGLMAQDLEQVLPEAVGHTTVPAERDSTGEVIYPAVEIAGIDYNKVTPVLVGALQEQQVMIAEMQVTIDQLRDQINQCCAANGNGMAPQGGQRNTAPESDVQEQRLLIIPNPVADLTTLEYYVPKAGQVSLEVSTSDGKPVETLREEKAEAGAYNYAWNTTKLAAGTYFCTFMLDGAVVVKRAVKVK
ncbi:MAG: tail fiber domain-containing protein [Flavobacteriales bacterium]|jgi:hypothetical protein|nr:tail fiber domain-containing protein [Flavobacteriales bacterium]